MVWWLDHHAIRYVPYAGHANDGIYPFKPPFNAPAGSVADSQRR